MSLQDDFKALQEAHAKLQADRDGAYRSLAPMQAACDKALQDIVDLKAAHAADLKAQADTFAQKLSDSLAAKEREHAQQIAKYKQDILVPALKEQAARAKSDVDLKVQAQIDALLK